MPDETKVRGFSLGETSAGVTQPCRVIAAIGVDWCDGEVVSRRCQFERAK